MSLFVTGTRHGRIKADYTTKDLYKWYKEKYKNPVEYSVFVKFIKEFYSEILNLVIYNGIDYILPGRLGSLRIRKKENFQRINDKNELVHNRKPNWGKTLKLWEEKYPNYTAEEIKAIPNKPIVYHLNEHTDNNYFRWYWDKMTCNVKNQTAYRFEPIRDKKREAAKAWKEIPKLRNIYYE